MLFELMSAIGLTIPVVSEVCLSFIKHVILAFFFELYPCDSLSGRNPEVSEAVKGHRPELIHINLSDELRLLLPYVCDFE